MRVPRDISMNIRSMSLRNMRPAFTTFIEDRYPQIFSELKEKEEISDDLDKVMAEALNAYGEEFKDTIK